MQYDKESKYLRHRTYLFDPPVSSAKAICELACVESDAGWLVDRLDWTLTDEQLVVRALHFIQAQHDQETTG